jgi:hypothetical protein
MLPGLERAQAAADVDRGADVLDLRRRVALEQAHRERVLEYLPEGAEDVVSRESRQLRSPDVELDRLQRL